MNVPPFPAVRTLIRAAWRVTPFKTVIKRAYHSRLNPMAWRRLGRACGILAFDYGLLSSMVRQSSVSRSGDPLPWYTYSATEFLKQLDFTTRSVFEYGSGNSTLFWARRARRVVSVEHELDWYRQVKPFASSNVDLFHEGNPDRYVRAVHRFDEHYDVIVVDGQSRLLCAREAVSRLKPGGIVILDNSDWFPNTSRVLRDANLLEVDFFGFGPLNDYTSATSVYFDRGSKFEPAGQRQPVPGIGSLPKDFDEAWWKD
jgi:hypothetical protein